MTTSPDACAGVGAGPGERRRASPSASPVSRVGARFACLAACLATFRVTACGAVADEIEIVAEINDTRLPEISGLAVSQRRPDVLWVVNDSGNPAELYAIATEGDLIASVAVTGVHNHDWEDLAAAIIDGRPYLLVADIGDNRGTRPHVTVWVVPEPDPSAPPARVAPARAIHFTYPDGPRDAEGLAVDGLGERILVLSKRTSPPQLYALTLRAETASPRDAVTAERLGPLVGIPPPTAVDLAAAPGVGVYSSQPTALDVDQALGLIVMTYARPYVFAWPADGSLVGALAGPPVAIDMPRLRQSEALAVQGRHLFVTSEQLPAPLLRVPLPAAAPTAPGEAPRTDAAPAAHSPELP